MRRLVVLVALVGGAAGLVGVGWWLSAAELDPRPERPQVVDLRADHARNPIGIDTRRPRLSWRLEAEDRGVEQRALQVRVASDPELLAEDEADVWDSGLVEATRPWVDYGGPTASATRYYWQARVWDGLDRVSAWSDPAYWETGLLDDASWGDAEWIGAPFDRADGAPLMRRTFTLPDTEVSRARLYVSGLGVHVAHLNGERVGDSVLDPGFTDYRRRILYTVHDVTGFLRQGENTIGVALGNGWFGLPTPARAGYHQAPWNGEPRLLLRLALEYDDGSREVVTSGPGWRAAEGPTRSDSVYAGEAYDARLAQPGWTEPGFDDDEWQEAVARDAPGGRLVAQPMEPTTVVDTVEPVEVTDPEPGVYVFDFGRVMAGWARLHVRGPSGTEVRLAYGERLDRSGRVDTTHERIDAPLQTDTYVLRGDAQETWEPSFTVKGFRYVEVEDYPGTPTPADLEGRTVHARVASAGRFESSDELLTRLHDNIRRVIAGNLRSVITADLAYERVPALADAQLSSPAALYQFDLARLLDKWLGDVADAQRDDGSLPTAAPASGTDDGEPAPSAGGAYLLLAWERYRHTGDERALERHYEGFRAYVDHLLEAAGADRIITTGLGDRAAPGTGGGPPPEGPALVSTAYFFHLTRTLAEIAEVVDEDVDAQRYWTSSEEIRTAFNAAFLDVDAGMYRTASGVGGSPAIDNGFRQTSQVVPLAFGIVPDSQVTPVLRSLVDDLAARDARLDTGVIGTRHLLPVLAEHGAVDLAYRVATQTEHPSWGHWLEAGATGLFDAWELDATSHGHHVLGSVAGWLYADLAGIAPLEPGYERVLVRPRIPTGPEGARGAVSTPRGTVGASWDRDGEQLLLRVSIPAGSTGEVHVPAADRRDVRESGRRISWRTPAVEFDRMERGAAVFRVASGAYEFTSRLD